MKFAKGQSGNPAGRPKGRPDRRTQMRQAFEQQSDALTQKAIEMALDGDAAALRICMDRLTPTIRPQAQPVEFTLSGDTLTEQAQSVLQAVAGGHLDPLTGKALIDAIGSLVKVAEIDDISRRLEALEDAKP